MMYIYVDNRGKLGNQVIFTVGFFRPDGQFIADSAFSTRMEARARVSYLNGSNIPDIHAANDE